MRKYIPRLFIVFVFLYLLWLIKPALLHKVGGTFETTEIPQDYQVLADFLAEDKDFSRTFWLPRKDNFGFYSWLHPSVFAEDFVCEAREKRPLSSLMTDKYNFLSYFQNPAAREIFKILGLKYVIVPFDSQEEIFLSDRKYDERKYQRRIDILDKVPWLSTKGQAFRIGLYEADFETKHFFPAKSVFFVVGADDLYQEIPTSPDFQLSDAGFYFFEENFGEKPKLNENDVLVFNKKNKNDLTLSFLENEYAYPFFPFLKEKDVPGWQAIDLVNSARTTGLGNIGFDFGQNMVLSRDSGSFKFSFDVSRDGECEIFIRVLANRFGGELQLTHEPDPMFIGTVQGSASRRSPAGKEATGVSACGSTLDNNKCVRVETKGKADEFVWKKIGSDIFLSKGKHELFVKNRRGLNALNLLAVLPKEKFLEYQKRAEEYLGNQNVFYIFNNDEEFKIPEEILGKETPEVSSKMLSLTKYLVEIGNAKEPFWLVFSETFHSLWEAKIGQEKITPVKLFSAINGFYIDKTGDFEITVEFKPQRYVYWGMMGSGITLLIIILFFINEFTS